MTLPKSFLGYALAVSGAILFSSKAVVVKMAYGQASVDAETLLALRMGCSAPIYLVIGALTLWSDKVFPTLRQVLSSMGVGIVGYWLASYTDFLGLFYISATFERLILFTYPLFVVILGWAFFGGKLHRGLVPSFLKSYAGLALVFLNHPTEQGSNATLGAILVLVCAVAFGLYQLLAKVQIAQIGSQLFTSIAMLGASLAAFAGFFIHHGVSDLSVVTTILPHAAFLAIGATVIPSYLLNAALARISAQANGAIGMISPIATIGMSSLLLGEKMTITEFAGAILVMSGVAFFVWSERKAKT
jgi:drug/metabolite transporter (DMT)-like permease